VVAAFVFWGEMPIALAMRRVAGLAKVGFDPVYGARPLKRAVQSKIENPLARAILEGRFAPKDTIRVDVRAGGIVFEKQTEKKAA